MKAAPAVAAISLGLLSPVASFIIRSRVCTRMRSPKAAGAQLSTRPRSRKQRSWGDRGGRHAGLALTIIGGNRTSIKALHFSSKGIAVVTSSSALQLPQSSSRSFYGFIFFKFHHPSPRHLFLNALTKAVETPAPRPTLPADFYSETLLDKVALALFRRLVQNEIGYKSDHPGYVGLVDEAQNYMVVQGATEQEQQDMVVRVLSTIAGPAVPPVYKIFMAPWPWAPFLTALFTPPFFQFLVGPNKMDVRRDETLGGVFVERCRFLEETNCKGLCTNMCKIPTERFFDETLGLTMAMEPNFDSYECRLSFGLTAPPMEEDDTVPRGCLSGCSCKALGAQVATSCSKQ